MNDTLKTIQSLRTIHGDFADRHISDEDLQIILDSAVRAANASGRQSYSIVVSFDKEKMKALSGYAGDCMLVFCVDYTRNVDMAKHLGHEFPVSDIMGFVAGSTDTLLAAQTACIAAKSIGIDSMFTNGIHRGDMLQVYNTLKLPTEHCFPLVALLLGYATEEPAYQQGRLNGAGIIHQETYHRLTPAERNNIVAEYDNPEKHLGLISDWAQKGTTHYLDWFYTKWVRRPDTKAFFTALNAVGFVPHAGKPKV